MSKPVGFSAPCPRCGEVAGVMLSVWNLESLRCDDCSGDFELKEIRAIIAGWQAVIAWIDRAGEFKAGEATEQEEVDRG